MDEFVSLQQFALRARRNLTRPVWDYLMGGSETETTLKRNRQALDSLDHFENHILRRMDIAHRAPPV